MEEGRLRVLYLSLEYSDAFSGNGVYAQSMVKNLVAQQCRVLVICGKPAGAPGVQKRQAVKVEVVHDFVEVRTVTVPVWFKLDRSSSWQEYGLGTAQHVNEVSEFQPDVILGVDWTSRLALESLQRADATQRLGKTPFVFLCFRVFSQTATGDDAAFYVDKEAETIRLAARTVALSKSDAKALEALLNTGKSGALDQVDALRPPSVYVVAPPLRDEVRILASKLLPPTKVHFSQRLQWEKWSSMMNIENAPSKGSSAATAASTRARASLSRPGRTYITCCCRISPEKGVMRFVEICELLQRFLKAKKLVPYLVGPATDPVFARRVYTRLKKAFPGDECIIVSDFVPPDKLQAIFTRTALNIHPVSVEPYGMTIAESASFGAPSLVDSGGRVGAVDLLPVADLCAWGTSMDNAALAAASARCALSSPLLDVIGARAQARALRWGAKEHAAAVRLLLEDVLKSAFRAYDKTLSPRSTALLQSAMDDDNNNNNGIGAEDADWPWLEMIQWAASDHDVGVIVECNVPACQRFVDDLLGLPPYSLAALLLQSRTQRELVNDAMLRWAAHLLARRGGSLGAARFRLVPSRLSEEAFWSIFFYVVKRGLSPARAAALTAAACSVASPMDGGIKPLPPAFSQVLSVLEHIVQRDECARGIGALIAALPPNQLEHSVVAMMQAKGRVLLLTGFPCLPAGGASAQETDGPPGIAALARALVACGKRVVVCIEEPNASVVRACIAALFPKAKALVLRENRSVTSVEAFGANGQVVVESFPVAWTPACDQRCDDLVSELAAEGGHMVAVERAGPGADGQCRTMKGRVMTSDVLAPLHVLFERRGTVGASAVGDGGNEVGMGNAVEAVRATVAHGKSIACVLGADQVLCCSVSNWGAYALAAGLAVVAVEAGKFKTGAEASAACLGEPSDVVERVVAAACAVGARDGINQHLHSVDGMPVSKSVEVFESLRSVVATL